MVTMIESISRRKTTKPKPNQSMNQPKKNKINQQKNHKPKKNQNRTKQIKDIPVFPF